MNDLISMRYLSVSMGAHSSVPSIGATSNNQDMHNSTDQNSSQSEITQLRSMNKLVQLGVFRLVNLSRAEADGAKLRDKKQLEKLLLSWKRIDDCHEPLIVTETEWERSQMNVSNNSWRYGPFIDMEHDVLEGLEPHQNLKHLQISGYSGYTYPAWLATSVTSLRVLHLEDCGEWESLPSLEGLPFLTKLKLRNMQKVNEVSIPSRPSLKELVLIEMPKLERCSCNSVRNLNFCLRVLILKRCPILKVFSLFENCEKLKIKDKSWLSCVEELTIYECPDLKVPNPLPPSSNVCKLNIAIVSTLPTMMGSSREQLMIGTERRFFAHDPYSDSLMELDDKILSFHNLRALIHLQIVGCRNLSSISVEGFRQLISLKTLEIGYCINLFSPDVLPEHAYEDMTDAFPSLKPLRIKSCGITGKWLSVMLQHAFALEELDLDDCRQISELLIERKESSSSNPTSTPRAPSAGNTRDALISRLLRIPSNLIPSLKKLAIRGCDELIYQPSQEKKKDFSDFTSLEELMIRDCPVVTLSLEHTYENNCQGNESWLLPHSLGKLEIYGAQETLQPRFLDYNCLKNIVIKNSPNLKRLQLCFCTLLEDLRIYDCKSLVTLHGNFTCLRKLELSSNPGLKWIQLRLCTALEDLQIRFCKSLYIIEGLQSLKGLRYLDVFTCPGLPSYLKRQLSLGYELLTGLERLHTSDYSFLTTSFCKRLNSLQEFCISRGEVTRFTYEQERALQQLKSLQDLRFVGCDNLAHLPVGLHSLPNLKKLEINDCRHISRLQEKDLPPSLEELEINFGCSVLIDECRMLATRRSKPKVKINGKYVN